MPINTYLRDGYGRGGMAKINGEGELSVVVHPHPPKDEEEVSLPYRAYFTSLAGATDMRVDGSTTNVSFSISADQERDIYIKTCSLVIADASAALNKFGNITALTNGCELSWETADLGTLVIADQLKTNFSFIRLALGKPSIGDGTTAFQAANVISTSEAYLPVIDFSELFGMPYGLRLRKATNDKISWIIKDNVTTIDQFDCIAYGIKF